jgi:hypothetical protein
MARGGVLLPRQGIRSADEIGRALRVRLAARSASGAEVSVVSSPKAGAVGPGWMTLRTARLHSR